MVNFARTGAGAESVVDIDHRETDRTAIQHSEECRNSTKAGPVAHTGRNGNHWRANKTRNHTRQGPLHTRDDNQRSRRAQARMLGQEPMNSGNANVVQPIGDVSHELARETRLLGNRQVGRARGNDQNGATTWLDVPLTKTNRSGERMKGRTRYDSPDRLKSGFVRARDQESLAVRHNLFGNARDLFGGFALTEDDFGKSLPYGSMVIDASKAQIRDWCGTQIVEQTCMRFTWSQRAALYLIEEFPKLRRGHKGCFSLTLPTLAVYR